ncbi:D-arabinose 1-dehydrogenase (NAD(P)(+)) [Martiniozyma asiatica (nom. inval.)]|nr:D-arabinose 1-dehydrogenase (NAD(P)(+)) [Martiniozyma asiatica]
MSALTKTIKLNSGAIIPAVGFGTASADSDTFPLAVKAAVLSGYRHIDTAWYYKTEKMIGTVLSQLLKSDQVKRSELFITSKVWPNYWDAPEESLEMSLSDLQIDYVDMLLQHWPICFAKHEVEEPVFDTNADLSAIEKIGTRKERDSIPEVDGKFDYAKDGDYLITYKKILALRETGKVKTVGVSNFTVEMLERIIKETGVTPAVNQVELHPQLPQLELYEYCSSKGIVLEAYSPFGSTGAPVLKLPPVTELAEKYNVTPGDIVVNYCLTKNIIILPRTVNPERVKKGYKLIELTKEDITKLEDYGVEHPSRYIVNDWAKSIGFDRWYLN